MAGSPLFRRGKALFAENVHNWYLPLSKFDKLWAGSWLILDDYARGVFPPKFLDQQKAYQAEKDYRFALPGVEAEQVVRDNLAKPFWFGSHGRNFLRDFIRLGAHLERFGIRPPARLLELGCGGGWMSEFLATMGFAVCGTTISEDDIRDARRRIQSLEAKGLPPPPLQFVAAPMESVHTAVAAGSFDAVFVYEALHHAHDWREAVRSSFACLKPGGWFLICREPNVLHTFVAYRVAKLSNTHEIGFRKSELIAALRQTGFRNVKSAGAKLHCWHRPHWIFAQK